MTRFRILGVVHILVGLLLLPLSMMFGLMLAPLVVLGPLWIIALGILLWRSGVKVRRLVSRTHLVAIGVAVLLCIHGMLALQAAARSADEGGGLLGAYGLIPMAYGLLLVTFSIVSLVLARSRDRLVDDP